MLSTGGRAGTRGILAVGGTEFTIHRLDAMGEKAARLPFSLKILLENLLRREDGQRVTRHHVEAVLGWTPTQIPDRETPSIPALVLLQDSTGVPAMLDPPAWPEPVRALEGNRQDTSH